VRESEIGARTISNEIAWSCAIAKFQPLSTPPASTIAAELAAKGVYPVGFTEDWEWVELPDKGPGEIVGDYLNRKNAGLLVVAFPSAATATVVVHLEVSQARFV
jgi:hypothetical protein